MAQRAWTSRSLHVATVCGVLYCAFALTPSVAGQQKPNGKPTAIVGAQEGQAFEDRSAEGGVLIGFEVTLGFSGVVQIVASIQPLYTGEGETKASKRYGSSWPTRVRVEAKPEYAVGAIQVKAGEQIEGMRVIFMRRQGDALDPKDKYESRWLGGTGGKKDTDRDAAAKEPRQLDGRGKPIIGVVGRVKDDLTAIGLIEAH